MTYIRARTLTPRAAVAVALRGWMNRKGVADEFSHMAPTIFLTSIRISRKKQALSNVLTKYLKMLIVVGVVSKGILRF